MPQPLNLTSGGGGTLLLRRQTCTLLYACPGTVHTCPMKSSRHGSEGPRGRTQPQGAATIQCSPDSELGEVR
jgi:hypothetical protein